jgi:MoaA/NifB/PqqE/SkfB family radical SAM enzyme
MFKFNELKQIHLEITNNCQASCPMCTRNIHGGVENTLINIEAWSINRYKKIINEEVLKQLDLLYFCGNYGDPLLNNDLLEMIQYTVDINSELELKIYTNASLRNKDWWIKLATTLPKNHRVIFAIDGLEDTHTRYRIGTDFNKIIENATAFITAGGKAEWAYLRFKHNEHQVEEAKSLAKTLGFVDFVMKDSSRFLMDDKFPVLNRNRETIYHLQPSQYSEIKFIDNKIIKNYKNIVKETKIECFALKQKEIYITAQGHVFPCCWLGMIPYQTSDEYFELSHIRSEILQQWHHLVDDLGGIDALNAESHSIKKIVNSHEYQTVWDKYWNESKLITCVRSCGVSPDLFSTPHDQFTNKLQLQS